MGYKLFVMIKLQGATELQAKKFYDQLKSMEWSLNERSKSQWLCNFNSNVSRYNAYQLIIRDLNQAKMISNIKEAEYKINMDYVNIMSGMV